MSPWPDGLLRPNGDASSVSEPRAASDDRGGATRIEHITGLLASVAVSTVLLLLNVSCFAEGAAGGRMAFGLY